MDKAWLTSECVYMSNMYVRTPTIPHTPPYKADLYNTYKDILVTTQLRTCKQHALFVGLQL